MIPRPVGYLNGDLPELGHRQPLTGNMVDPRLSAKPCIHSQVRKYIPPYINYFYVSRSLNFHVALNRLELPDLVACLTT
jgi:hypothetical protein